MKYEILDSSGLWWFNFTGMKLEYVCDYDSYGVQLKQPAFDINGKRCPVGGFVVMDKKSVKRCDE